MSVARRFLLGEVARQGYVRAADHPSHVRTLRRMVAEGSLVPLLRGVYGAPGSHDPALLSRFICAQYPNATIIGRAAAALTFWPGLQANGVGVARPSVMTPRAPFTFVRRRIPAELRIVTPNYAVTDPALTALDLCDEVGGDGIDQALRTRATTLDRLRRALELTPARLGNPERRQLLIDSRDEPWSAAERLLHRILRDGRLTGWVANHPIPTGPVGCYFADVAFPAQKVIIEVEGHRFHSSPEQLHRDRTRQNELTSLGWRVIRVDWPMLVDDPEGVLRLVRGVVDRRRAS